MSAPESQSPLPQLTEDTCGNTNDGIYELINFMASVPENPLLLKNLPVSAFNFPDTGRGFKADRKINHGEAMISIPEKFLITSSVLVRDEFIKFLIENIIKKSDKISWKELFIIFLVYYRRKLHGGDDLHDLEDDLRAEVFESFFFFTIFRFFSSSQNFLDRREGFLMLDFLKFTQHLIKFVKLSEKIFAYEIIIFSQA